jgi:hypothetical protein
MIKVKKLVDKKNIIPAVVAAVLTVFGFFSIYMYAGSAWGLYRFLFIPVLLVLNWLFLAQLKHNFTQAKKKWKCIAELILVLIFGTFLIKSFVIYIYPVARMAVPKAMLFGFGWSIIGMALTYVLIYWIAKLSWQGREYKSQGIAKYLMYCIPSLIILGAVFVIYYPGVGSGDTLYIWEQIHANNYTDTHPLMFLMLYKGLSLIWDNIAVITLFQFITCVAAFGYVAYYFSGKGLSKFWSWAIAIALPLLPVNAFYSVMLWKDIPYSVGLLIFIVLSIKVLEDGWFEKIINILWFVLVGLFVMFVRHNGFIPILGTVGLMGLYYLCKKHFKTMFKVAAAAIALVVLFYGIKSGVGSMLDRKEAVAADEGQTVEESVSYDNKTIIPTVFPTTIAMQQLIYIQNYYGDTFTAEQKEKFGLYLKEEALGEHKFEYRMGNKYGPNWEFYHKPYLTQKGIAIPDLPAFWDYYFEVCSEHPITALESYQKLTGIIWASVGYGPTAFRGYAYDDFTQYVSKGYASFMRPAKDALDNSIFRLYNGFFIIFTRPALYLFVILLFCFAGVKRHKSKYLIVMSSVFLNIAGYLVVITAQDVRYFFINMLAFIVAIAYAAMKPAASGAVASNEE